MSLKTPSFWYPQNPERTSLAEKLLSPLSAIYGLLYKLDHLKTEKKTGVPVLCIGNIVAGGTGKTPTALAIMNLIQTESLAKKPFFLTRGYGGATIGPIFVDPNKHTAWEVGDEALILAQYAPTVVCADRVEGAAFAKTNACDLIVMDDGLQNPGIHKDLKFVVVNGEMGFGNGKMMPAGPMRQPLEKGLKNADAFIFIGEDFKNLKPELNVNKPVINARVCPRKSEETDKDAKYIAFAGLGYPDKFFNFLKHEMGLNVVETIRFADHCPYDEKDLIELGNKAKVAGARLITTEKDFMRLPKIEGIDVEVMPVKLVIENDAELLPMIRHIVSQAS